MNLLKLNFENLEDELRMFGMAVYGTEDPNDILVVDKGEGKTTEGQKLHMVLQHKGLPIEEERTVFELIHQQYDFKSEKLFIFYKITNWPGGLEDELNSVAFKFNKTTV